MKLSIGMATFDDFDGVAFSMQSLLLHHDGADHDLLVVDNNPASRQGQRTKDFCAKSGVRYIPMPEGGGTTQPRERIFREAKAEAVLVLDSHVLFETGVICELAQFYEDEAGDDLYSGPILMENGRVMATEFRREWRGGMWGVWHKEPRGEDRMAPPYAIWGQGLGAFTCRKAAWLGFNPHFRGFGGEEGYIHEKFRQAGRNAVCLPFLRWWHRFNEPSTIPYVNSLYQRVRNYVLGFMEIGRPIDEIRRHFFDSGLLSDQNWRWLLEDPIGHEHEFGYNPQSAQRKLPAGEFKPSLDELLIIASESPRFPLKDHAKTLRALASTHSSIFALTTNEYWNAVLAAARAPFVLSHHPFQATDIMPLVNQAIEREHTPIGKVRTYTCHSGGLVNPENCDLLVLDGARKAENLLAQLERFGVKSSHRILIAGTGMLGDLPEKQGLFEAIKAWLKQRPQWFVMLHETRHYGFTVLSCRPTDRPQQEIVPWPLNHGPGTELKKILESLGINPGPACDCRSKQRMMDTWGVAGCREHFTEIVEWMRQGQYAWGWAEKLKAAANAVFTGLAFHLDVLDPFPSLIEESIRRAELLEQAEAAAEKEAA